jgi:hypothetical protein
MSASRMPVVLQFLALSICDVIVECKGMRKLIWLLSLSSRSRIARERRNSTSERLGRQGEREREIACIRDTVLG